MLLLLCCSAVAAAVAGACVTAANRALDFFDGSVGGSGLVVDLLDNVNEFFRLVANSYDSNVFFMFPGILKVSIDS